MIADPAPPSVSAGAGPGAHLRRVVLGSRSPRRAAAWYRRAFGLPDADSLPNGGDEALTAGELELRIAYRSQVAPAAVEPNRLILNFVVEDILEIEARLVAMEAVWVRELERTPWGIIGTVLDLDGNLVQIIEPAQQPLPWAATGREEHQ